MKRLYKLKTRGLGIFYVISENPDFAEKELYRKLEADDYGFTGDRKVEEIIWLSDEVYDFANKPFFSNKDNRLIII